MDVKRLTTDSSTINIDQYAAALICWTTSKMTSTLTHAAYTYVAQLDDHPSDCFEDPRALPLAILNGSRAAEPRFPDFHSRFRNPGFRNFCPRNPISGSWRAVAFPDPLTRSFVRRMHSSFFKILDDADSQGFRRTPFPNRPYGVQTAL